MEAGSGLIEDIEDALIFRARKMRGKFQALRFAARKRGGGLAEPEIAEADFIQDAQLGDDFGNTIEEGESLARRELQDFVNIFAAITNIEDAGFEARATAFFADKLDVGEKLHFDGDGAVALAGFAAAARNVERKMAGRESAALGVGSGGEDFANGVEGFEISCGIRTRRAADGRLVDNDDFKDAGVAFEAVAEFFDTAPGTFGPERTVKNIMHKCGFA